jgi:hypothetical protein
MICSAFQYVTITYYILSDWDPELESHIEGNLATEVSMIVLDTLTVVEQVLSEQHLKY